MTKSEIRCPSILCIKEIKEYGENYHGVHTIDKAPIFLPDAIVRCERCGGYSNGYVWVHVCNECGLQVKEDELKALFVPHKCKNCEEKLAQEQLAQEQIQSGEMCNRCSKPRSRCYC